MRSDVILNTKRLIFFKTTIHFSLRRALGMLTVLLHNKQFAADKAGFQSSRIVLSALCENADNQTHGTEEVLGKHIILLQVQE